VHCNHPFRIVQRAPSFRGSAISNASLGAITRRLAHAPQAALHAYALTSWLWPR